MKKEKWHLDVSFPQELFRNSWSGEAHSTLLKLFAHLDSTSDPVMSMLPAGISPSGAAVAASFYFLPGSFAPPRPHCRIAIYPGLHFVKDLVSLTFDPAWILEAARICRTSKRGFAGMSRPLQLLQRHMGEARSIEQVHFHWLWACARSWTVYDEKKSKIIAPRQYYGREDDYEPCLILIESEKFELYSDSKKPFDLFIYCPNFDRSQKFQNESDFNSLVRKIDNFNAHRKLIIARSPYSYWSRQLEPRMRGLSFAMMAPITEIANESNSVRFLVVDQFLSLSLAEKLFFELKKIARSRPDLFHLIKELRSILRRILASVDPYAQIDSQTEFHKIESICSALALDEATSNIFLEVRQKFDNRTSETKLDKLKEIAKTQFEIWVTKDSDKITVEKYLIESKSECTVRLADRWMTMGSKNPKIPTVITRIDRENDLDLISYLRGGDVVLMSTWEAVTRKSSIDFAWERSERWRNNSLVTGIEKKSSTKFHDPVTDLADFFLKLSPSSEDSTKPNTDNWWDDKDIPDTFEVSFGRDEILSAKQGNLVGCLEVLFCGGCGMFFKSKADVQIFSGGEDEEEIDTIDVEKLAPGNTVILFKDSERNSIFDIMMDHLEASRHFADDAKAVREWKSRLKTQFNRLDFSITTLATRFKVENSPVDPVTIRSWILGSTMAPMHVQNLELLGRILEMDDMDLGAVFQSVRKLRGISRTLGRALNYLVLNKNLDGLEGRVRDGLADLEIDIEGLASLIETREVLKVIPGEKFIDSKFVGKLFRI